MLLDCTDRNEKWYCQHGMIVTDNYAPFFAIYSHSANTFTLDFGSVPPCASQSQSTPHAAFNRGHADRGRHGSCPRSSGACTGGTGGAGYKECGQ